MFFWEIIQDLCGESGTEPLCWNRTCWISGKMHSLVKSLNPCEKNLSWIHGRCSGVCIYSCHSPHSDLFYQRYEDCEDSKGTWGLHIYEWWSACSSFLERVCSTVGATAYIWNITLGPAVDGTDFLTVTFFKVRNQFLVSPVLTEISDERKLVRFEFLILWRMGIIKSLLPERNVSADKGKKIANHSLLVLNVVK